MANKRLPISAGDQYNNWTVLSFAESRPEGRRWLCRCKCGTERVIVGTALARGKVKSCGCLRTGLPATLNGADRFWAKVGEPNQFGCREYQGARTAGYGIHSWQGKSIRASRLAWQLANDRPIPPGMFICHACDNPPCCEPTHLFLGSNEDNTADRENKGRGPQGVRNPRAKITPNQVREVRQRYAAGGVTIRALADELGLSKQAMYQAIRRKNWKHVA